MLVKKFYLLSFILLLLCLNQCEQSVTHSKQIFTAEEVKAGKVLASSYGCVSCHVIPGLKANPGHVGPSLERWGERKYISGQAPNTPAYLIGWLLNPHSLETKTAMPNQDLSPEEARKIAAFLYSLKD